MAQGFDFRATSAFVSDPAGTTYVLTANTYPTTRAGATFGWTDPFSVRDARDRSAAGDARLAGIVFTSSASGTLLFTYDLPAAGTYDINLALGDFSGASSPVCKIRDNTTVLTTISGMSPAANNYVDATGVTRTAAAWPGSNAAFRATFASTKLVLEMGPQIANITAIAHLLVTEVNASSFAGAATLGPVAAGGSLQAVLSAFAGGATLGAVAAGGSLGAAPGVFVLGPIKVNGAVAASAALDYVRIYSDAGVLLYERTGGSLDASGNTTLTTTAAPPGTLVRIDWQLSTGRRRMPRVTMGA